MARTFETDEARKAYNKDYLRGWRSSLYNTGDGALERADMRGESDAWYDGYHDVASGRSKFHYRDCGAIDHSTPECTIR